MKDRVPLYPGRVKLTPVSGQENTYDMVRADEPTQEGDPLGKNTLLKDETAARFGLPVTAVPNDVFAMLLNAQIIVTAPTGSTVTCAKGGIVLTAVEDNGTWTFNVPEYGKWTITMSNGSKTVSENVLVDMVTQYKIEMEYKLWLYRDGDEREDVTGGWSTQMTSTTQGTIDKGGSSITLTTVNSGTYNIAIETVNRIDKSILSAYSKLCISYSLNNDRASYLGLTDTVGANPKRVAIVELRSSETYYELSIPETISDDYYVFVNAWGIGSAKTILTVKRVWLE